MLEAEQQGSKKRRLPRGTSEYQAAWITDDIIEGDDDVSEEEEGDAAGNADEHDDVRYDIVIMQPLRLCTHNIFMHTLYLPYLLAMGSVCYMRPIRHSWQILGKAYFTKQVVQFPLAIRECVCSRAL